MVDYPRSVEGVEVGLLFRQIPRKGIKVSFRSNGAVNVNTLARRLAVEVTYGRRGLSSRAKWIRFAKT